MFILNINVYYEYNVPIRSLFPLSYVIVAAFVLEDTGTTLNGLNVHV